MRTVKQHRCRGVLAAGRPVVMVNWQREPLCCPGCRRVMLLPCGPKGDQDGKQPKASVD